MQKHQDLWNNGDGIVIFECFCNATEHLALCREYAMILAAKEHLTNAINGCCYGDMKESWNFHEVFNYGEMLLYYSFFQCIVQRPVVLFPSDFVD